MQESKHTPFTCKNDTCRGVWLSELTNVVTYQRPLLQCPKCGQRYAWTYYTGGGAELVKVLDSHEIAPLAITPTPVAVDIEATSDTERTLLDALEAHALASAKELNAKILAYIEDRLVRDTTRPEPAGLTQAQLDEIVAFLKRARSPDSLTTARDNLAEAMTLLDRLVASQKKL